MTAFYERYWSKRRGKPIGDLPLMWPILRRHITKEPGAVIVDFGCGDGEITGAMPSVNPKAKYIGLDVSAAALAVATSHLPNIEFHQVQDGGRFPLADVSVDFVFSSEVIEHIYDTENAFCEMARVLRPGGQLLLTTPYHGLVKNLLITILDFDKHFDPTGPHVRFFSKKSLFACLRKIGLEPVTYGYTGRFYPIPHSIYVLARKEN